MKKWFALLFPCSFLIFLSVVISDLSTEHASKPVKHRFIMAAESGGSGGDAKASGGGAKASGGGAKASGGAAKAAAGGGEGPKDDNKPQQGPIDTTPVEGSGGVGSVNPDGTTNPAAGFDDDMIPNGGASTVPPRDRGPAGIDPNKIPIPGAGASTERFF